MRKRDELVSGCMAKAKPAPLYVGATTCDLRPDWLDTDRELIALLETCHATDPDDDAPELVLADWLAEHNDPREAWVRASRDLWAACRTIKPAGEPWNYQKAKAVLSPVCESVPGWRLAGLWGCLVAWHAPAATGGPMGRTWADERVRIVQRCLWWWALGLATTNPVGNAAWSQADAAESQADVAWSQAYAAGRQAYAAWSQAYAAERQADVAWSQAYAAERQAYAAWSQAYAAERQADAAGRQAYAAGNQAYAAERQAYAAGRQAYAAERQADAAGRQVWQFARQSWELCAARLPELIG